MYQPLSGRRAGCVPFALDRIGSDEGWKALDYLALGPTRNVYGVTIHCLIPERSFALRML